MPPTCSSRPSGCRLRRSGWVPKASGWLSSPSLRLPKASDCPPSRSESVPKRRQRGHRHFGAGHLTQGRQDAAAQGNLTATARACSLPRRRGGWPQAGGGVGPPSRAAAGTRRWWRCEARSVTLPRRALEEAPLPVGGFPVVNGDPNQAGAFTGSQPNA